MQSLKRENQEIINDDSLKEIYKRLNALEDRVYKGGRKSDASLPQKILLMQSLGLLENFDKLKISKNKRAKVLAILLELDSDYIEGCLKELENDKNKIMNKINVDYLVNTFMDLGLHKLDSIRPKYDEIFKIKLKLSKIELLNR